MSALSRGQTPDPDVFTASDQREREIIWDALGEYQKSIMLDPEAGAALAAMIERVSQTFSWVPA